MAAHKKGLWSEVVVPKKCFSFVFYHSLMDTVFILEEDLQPWIWQIFLFKVYCKFKGALPAICLSGTVIISGVHLAVIYYFQGYCVFLK